MDRRKLERQKSASRKAAFSTTPSSRRHHFTPFTQRIARLKIDPIRRQRNHDNDDYDASAPLTSNFRTALDRWTESNQSDDFTKFSRQVAPLCDSLPQVLHHQQRILDLLLEYIEKGNAVAVEPLLDLVPRLAQDVQAQFESHFKRTVTTVASLAAKHQDLEVVEWSFNCLTWLFKYLERLLVSDICPLYTLLAPLLGKERQKDFITRFAAESLSFLVKRASKKQESISNLVKLALDDLCQTALERDCALYEAGIKHLFLEAIKGVQEHIHSKGSVLFQHLLSRVLEMNKADSVVSAPAVRVLRGVLGQLLHHTRVETFQPILDVVLSQIALPVSSSLTNSQLELSAQLLLLITGLRRGSRVADWAAILRILSSYTSFISIKGPDTCSEAATDVLAALAVAHQTCPLDVAISYTKIFDEICCTEWQHFFLGFCSLYSELGNDRFRSLMFPYFLRFVAKYWDGTKHELLILIPKLVVEGQLPNISIKLPRPWTMSIVNDFNNLIGAGEEVLADESTVFYLNGLLEALRIIPVEPELESQLSSQIQQYVLHYFRKRTLDKISALETLFLGNGLKYIVNCSQVQEMDELWPLLCSASEHLSNRPIFLQSILDLLRLRNLQIDSTAPETQKLVESLLQSLASPTHDLRLASLNILQIVVTARDGEESEILASAISIEQTEPTIESARSISMHIRNLAARYPAIFSDAWLSKAIPVFCFGLLHMKFSQIWEDVCFALKEICSTKEGEEVVCATAFQWLESSETVDSEIPDVAGLVTQSESHETDFAGSSFQNLQWILKRNMALNWSACQQLANKFRERHASAPLANSNNRTQALKVLGNIPQVAEKRSRSLVPVLLAWASRIDINQPSEESVAGHDNPKEEKLASQKSYRWTRKEQKAMLSLFALFTNPRVLYKSAEVHAALLFLLEHGDAEIQKSALQALFSWKDPSINRYEEDLLKLLDDAKFREQISVFLDMGESDGSLRADDRAAAMPIILRLLYGRVTTRGKGDQHANRKAVFVLLSRFHKEEIIAFINIALGSLDQMALVHDGAFNIKMLNVEYLPQRKQFGLLNMLKDLLETWKTKAAPYIAKLVDPVFYCLIRAVRDLDGEGVEKLTKTSLARSIRQVSIQCLNMLFEITSDFDWSLYMPTLFQELINPRLGKFAVETAQGTSGLLRMFAAWCRSDRQALFLDRYNTNLLSKVAECIGLPTAKDEVKRFAMNEILCPLIEQAGYPPESSSSDLTIIVQKHSAAFLQHLAHLLLSDPPKELLEDGVQAVVKLSDYATSCPIEILSSAAFLLQMPARRASHRVKTSLLKILLRFLPTVEGNEDVMDQIYAAVCASFAFFKDRESRTLLSGITRKFADKDQSLVETAQLCEDLNSFATGRLDQPDRDLQSRAFRTINEERYMLFTPKQWRLLLGNLMFYIKDYDVTDMRDSDATRANASYGLRRFVEAASHKTGEDVGEFLNLIKGIVISGIQKGLRDQPKDVQAEYLAVLAHTIRLHPQWPEVNDMIPLLAEDEEASFFLNIHHTQHHRRTRAMKRLAEKVEMGTISSKNVYHILIPLIERFIFDTDERASETAGAIMNRGLLTAEAIRTLGVLIEWVDWQQCRVILKRFIGFVKTKTDTQETVLKLLDAVATSVSHSAGLKSKPLESEHSDLMEIDLVPPTTRLSQTLPSKEKICKYLIEEVIAPLSLFLREKDESFVSRRIIVAVIVARFLQMLPDDEFQIRLPALLIDTCNILRSKDQGSRDATRRALTTICTLIGPSSVGFVLRELRSALQRGFYLHVLSFTVHSILETTAPNFKPGDLDYCASDIVSIIMEDVFGNTGKEKEAAEYLKDKNTKKEVKAKKSFDSMQLLASVTSLSHLLNLIRPIESLLLGRVNLKDVRHIDELLRRIELGLLQNGAVKDRDVLIFCYEIIKDTQKISSNGNSKPLPSKYVDKKNQKVVNNSLRSTEAVGRLIRFSLELVRAVLRKHKSLQTSANIDGFMPIIGDALLSNQDDVKLASIRLFTTILNIPLPRIDSDAPVYIAEAARIIEDSSSTNDELSQAALKLISAVLRERRSAPVKVKEKTLAILLKKIKPDLQIISQQGVAFNLLRSIISRKIIIPEVYEVIDGDDGIASISVRDHDRTTRDLARGVYFQFLMEYPQAKGRFAKQLTFLVRNLEYEHSEGRQSVMETFHLLLTKVGDPLVQEIVREACWPLVSVMVNDDSSDCREMAAGLVKTVFSRADDEWLKNFLALSRRMLEHGTKAIQKRTAMQCWTIYLEVKKEDAEDVTHVMKNVEEILDQDTERFNTEEWQLIYYALHTLLIVCKQKPDAAFAKQSYSLWEKVQKHLSFPQSWVKQEAAKVVGMYVAEFASSNVESLAELPLVGSQGLQLDGNRMCELTARNLRLLREGVSEELAAQTVRNLAFVGRCFAANKLEWYRQQHKPNPFESAKSDGQDEGESESEEEAGEETADVLDASKENPSAIQHLFQALAGILRRELRKPSDPTQVLYRRADALHPKIASLKLISALCSTLSIESLVPSLNTIFLPLIHLTDTTITAPTSQDAAFTDAYSMLVDNATELLDLLREKMGTTLYVQVLQGVRKVMQGKREERRVKRKILAVSRPEVAERGKIRKREAEKARRKEKGSIARGMRRGW